MSSANVLPSAPLQELLYPQLQLENFRLQKINEIANTLDQEVSHYRPKKNREVEYNIITN